MALTFHPEPGTVLVCDFHGCVGAEMNKRRPVLVISPKLKHRTGLCTIVPLSTTEPRVVQPYHLRIEFNPVLPPPFDSPEMWVKGDMVASVAFQRLELIRTQRMANGKREYLTAQISGNDLSAVYRALLNGLGLARLTPHL
jgi:mRNA interferase MazF